MEDEEKMAGVSVRDPQDREIDTLSAENVRLEYPDMRWRADPVTGIDSAGRLYSAVYERLFVSDDDGRNWSWSPIEFDGFVAASGFGVLPDGTLLLLYRTSDGDGVVSNVAVARSTDKGGTWSPGEAFDTSPFTGNPDADGQKFCLLPDGAIIIAVSLRNGDAILDHDGKELPVDQKGVHDHVYRSTDGGLSWDDRTPIMRDSAESNFVSLGGDRVLAVVRRQRWYSHPDDPPGFWKQTGGSPEMIYKHIFLVDSHDGGRTWHGSRQWTRKEGDCPGELVRLSDGRVVLIHCSRYPNERSHVRARVSEDDGRSWSDQSYVVSEGSGYPGSVVLGDDTIVTVCGNTKLKPTSKHYISPHANAEPWSVHAVRWHLP